MSMVVEGVSLYSNIIEKIHDDQENQYKGQYRQKKPLLTMKILSGSRISSMDAATT